MLDVKTFVFNPLQTNCYVVSDQTDECVIIDCGALYEEEHQAITGYIQQRQLRPRHLLCTHGHFDHIFGCEKIYQSFGLSPEAHQGDEFFLNDLSGQLKRMMDLDYVGSMPAVRHWLSDGDMILFGDHRLKVMHTPGHSLGGIVFYCEEEHVLFSGDTLFRMSIGRTDFEDGDYEQILDSLHNVIGKLPKDTKVYTGHGPMTTIGEELRMNPYFR